MKKIKLYIAASLDGYIARHDGDLDWLIEDYPITPDCNYGYNDFFESIDTVIMGGRTYRDIICMDAVWPYKDKTTYVVIITYIPVILGNGISLFPNNPKESKWSLAENKGYKNGVLQVIYSIA